MNYDLKKILVEIVCVVVRNVLNIWKREVLKKKKASIHQSINSTI